VADDDDQLVNKLLKGEEFSFMRKYDEALALFKKIEKDYPNSPAGYFGELMIWEVKMLEREDMSADKEFLDVIERSRKVVDDVMQRYQITALDLFLCSGVIGMEGMHSARKQSWWHAYTRGTLSRQLLNRLKKEYPDFIDADLGLGLYLYWRSVFSSTIPVLSMFFKDKREEGIALVEKVASNGKLAKKLARVNLGIINMEEKKYQKAVPIFSSFIDQYPQNAIIRNFRGRAYLLDKKYEEAINDFEKILQIDESLVKAHYFIGLSHFFIAKDPKKSEHDKIAKVEFNKLLEKEQHYLWRSYSYYWLGQIAEREDDKKAAISYYEKAYALNKGLKNAKFRLHALGGGI